MPIPSSGAKDVFHGERVGRRNELALLFQQPLRHQIVDELATRQVPQSMAPRDALLFSTVKLCCRDLFQPLQRTGRCLDLTT